MLQRRLIPLLAAGAFIASAVSGVGTAFAFSETKIAPVQPPAGQAPAQPLQLQKPEGGDGLSLTTPGAATSGGTELRIPGVGSIGTLPKLDFGLDLLYGQDSNSVQEQRPMETDGNGVTIKGTIRHRF